MINQEEIGQITARVNLAEPLVVAWAWLLRGGAGAVEDASGGADVHVQGDAVVGVAGHAGHVGGVELPGEQGGGTEHVPQAVPGPLAVAADVAPSGGEIGGLEDVAAEIGRPPVLSRRGGEDQPQRVGASGLLGTGLLEASGERRAARRADSRRACGEGRPSCGTCGSSAALRKDARRPRPPCGPPRSSGQPGRPWGTVRAVNSPHRSPL